MPSGLTWSCETTGRLLVKSVYSIVAESSFHVALLAETVLIVRTLGPDALAIYGAVFGTIQFLQLSFSFLLVTTLSQIGLTVGARRWSEVGPRFRFAVATAMYIGCTCAVTIFILQDFVFRLMNLGRNDPHLLTTARQVISVRIFMLPFMMVSRVCSGFLGGYQRIRTMAVLSATVAIMEVLSQVVALLVFKSDLVGASIGSVVTSVISCVFALVLVGVMPPEIAKGKIQLLPDSVWAWWRRSDRHPGIYNPHRSRSPPSSSSSSTLLSPIRQVSFQKVCSLSFLRTPSAKDFMSASRDTIIRSVLMSGSVYALTIVTANFGLPLLAAHKVAHDLWHTMSVVVDGFSTVGQMMGSRLFGALEEEEEKEKQLIQMQQQQQGIPAKNVALPPAIIDGTGLVVTTPDPSPSVSDDVDFPKTSPASTEPPGSTTPTSTAALNANIQQVAGKETNYGATTTTTVTITAGGGDGLMRQSDLDFGGSALLRVASPITVSSTSTKINCSSKKLKIQQQIVVLRDMLTLFGAVVGIGCGLVLHFGRDHIVAYLFPPAAPFFRSTVNMTHAPSSPQQHTTATPHTTHHTQSHHGQHNAAPPVHHHQPESLSDIHVTVALLLAVWPLLSSFQIVNAILFVFDGMMYGAQAFAYIRNLMAICILGWFVPALLIFLPTSSRPALVWEFFDWIGFTDDHKAQNDGTRGISTSAHGHPHLDSLKGYLSNPLVVLWLAMCGVSIGRMVGGFYLMYIRIPRQWGKSCGDLTSSVKT